MLFDIQNVILVQNPFIISPFVCPAIESPWGWHESTDNCTEWDELQGHVSHTPRRTCFQQKASLLHSLEGTSCLVEVLVSHEYCRGDGFYLNLVGKCEELWAILAFCTRAWWSVFKGMCFGYSCVCFFSKCFLSRHLLPARLFHALMKVVNKPQPLPCLALGLYHPLRQWFWVHSSLGCMVTWGAESPSIK